MASDKIDIGIKLNLINWPVWSVRMLCGLRIKSLACTIREPGPDGIDRDKDDRARGFIGLWVEDYHLPTVESAASTFEMWNTLKASYAGQSIANQLHLRKQLHDLKLGHGEPITKYVARAQAIAAALDAAKDPVRESELVRYILAGLPQEYAHYIAVVDINTATADLTVATVHNQLLNVEVRVSKSDNPAPDKAYMSTVPGKYPPNNPDHRDKMCNHCGHKGHIKPDCRKFKREQAAGRGRGQGSRDNGNRSGSVALMARTNNDTTIYTELDWVIDSGASRHMSPHKGLFLNFRELNTPSVVRVGNGNVAEAAGIGSIELSPKVILHEVLYFPRAHIQHNVCEQGELGSSFSLTRAL